ncbi:FHA domain-containing protein [Actinokineospora bangkokensis]|uniref:FHA domain-containing protein n=1 Tax=Actinokineospora bangkokensis TaxID=1193682 RepID=A0A1Q9LCN6_9PSEU|nr:FHA domain-containing protein [Actinokineospora bangkokensis]OLR89798.1 hypothetical protein BJP25_01890 [Actinokineospora bangkokensis]
MPSRYRAGGWTAVLGRRCALLLAVPPDSPVVAACWAQVDADPLELLAAATGGALRGAPDFAIAGQGVLLLRGAARAVVGDEEFAGAGVSTWREVPLAEGVGAVTLVAEDATGPALPLLGGIVAAGELHVDFAGTAQPHPAGRAPDEPEARQAQPIASQAAPPEQRDEAPEQPVPPVSTEPAQPDDAPAPSALGQPVSSDVVALEKPTSDPVLAQPPPAEVAVPDQRDEVPPEPTGMTEVVPGGATTTVAAVDAMVSALAQPASGATEFIPRDATQVITHLDWAATPPPPRALAPGHVLAVRCSQSHLNPPEARQCRACQGPIAEQEIEEVPRPVLGALRFSTGDLIPLDRGVVIGRAPDASATAQGVRHVLKVPGDDISRTHAEVRLDGWRVLVVDLGSRNGTSVTPQMEVTFEVGAERAVELAPWAYVALGTGGTGFTYEVTG